MGLLEFFTGDPPPLIKGALEDVCEIINSGRDMFGATSARLLDNEILDLDLHVLSAGITQREQACRNAVLEHLNVDPRRELVLSLKLLTVAQEAARLGDLALMMKHTSQLAHKPRMGSVVAVLRTLRNRTLRMFDQTRDCFVDGDPSLAQTVKEECTRIKEAASECLRQLAAQAEGTANEGVVYAMATHTISRVSSHMIIIASSVLEPFHKIGE